MVHFVVWLKNDSSSGKDAADEFTHQRPSLTSIFQRHTNVAIVMESEIGIHCEAPDSSTIDSFEKDLPPQWQIDRSQYTIENF